MHYYHDYAWYQVLNIRHFTVHNETFPGDHTLVGLARWPAHLATTHNMNMHMEHRLGPMLAIINNRTVTGIANSFRSSNLAGNDQQMSNELQYILKIGITEANSTLLNNRILWNTINIHQKIKTHNRIEATKYLSGSSGS